MTAPVGTRMVFPEDRTAFVYQRPGQPILTPPRVGMQIFVDQACTTLADIQTLAGVAIPYSTIYINDDTLLPEFLGPPQFVVTLWAKVVGQNVAAHSLSAQYSGRFALSPTLGNGLGPPDPAFGAVGSFYVDRGSAPPLVPLPVLYGPKTQSGWPSQGVALSGVPGPPGGTVMVPISVATATWQLTHTSPYPPTVTTIDSANQEIFGDVSWPSSGLVVVQFGAPVAGTGILKI